jgi:hypothetical protein
MRGWLVTLAVSTAALSGCHSDPFCLNCGANDASTASTDLSGIGAIDLLQPPDDLTTPPDLTNKPDGAPCVPTNGGVEKCDHLDNDCNGITDDVAMDKLVGDPNNCGACGNACDFTAQHQFGKCVGGFDGGTPTCVPDTCLPGYVQLPGHTSCDYKCTTSNGGVEICDGVDNNCDGQVDEPFTTTFGAGGAPNYDKDLTNCGACAVACALPGAVNKCVGAGAGGKGVCQVDHCINNGTDTYKHNPAKGMLNVTGCEYHCPVHSTTVTTGSNDCDNTACAFPAEVCDGIDNDCNFLTDDSPTDVGGSCGQNCPGGKVANCVGECKAGTIVCSSGVKLCMGSTAPSAETCDGKDNDCNGTTDDGFGYPNYNSDPKNCGACGTVCNLAHAINKCVTDLAIDASGKGVCEVLSCNTGFNYAPLQAKAGDPAGTCTGGPPGPENGPTGVGCYYTCPVNPQAPESCNGKDDNCDGCVDNGLTTPPNFCSNLGVCAGQGITPNCTGAGGYRCNYSVLTSRGITVDVDASGNLMATEKECDGLDNNCNGVVDKDGFPSLGNSCTAGGGICANSGTIKCNPTNALLSGCFDNQTPPQPVTASPLNARDESCNGKDDDCDGQIDERTPKAGSMCYTGPGGAGAHACKGWVDPMVKVTTVTPNVYVYEYEATRPDATSTSQGGNSTRACANAGVLPWSNVTEAQAAAACTAIKDSAGVAMRLCSAAEWTAACEGPAPPAAPLWSLSANRNTYVANICNNADHAGAAVWATGTNSGASATNFCYTDWSSVDPGPATNRVYDMTGNLNEWTSSTVVSGGNTYFKVRGGTYTSPKDGTTCEFDFDIFPASFANSDVGFRCCSTNAP